MGTGALVIRRLRTTACHPLPRMHICVGFGTTDSSPLRQCLLCFYESAFRRFEAYRTDLAHRYPCLVRCSNLTRTSLRGHTDATPRYVHLLPHVFSPVPLPSASPTESHCGDPTVPPPRMYAVTPAITYQWLRPFLSLSCARIRPLFAVYRRMNDPYVWHKRLLSFAPSST